MERRRINEIINGKRSMTPDTAIRLGWFFGITPEYWLNLQMKMDLWEKLQNPKKKKAYKGIKPIAA